MTKQDVLNKLNIYKLSDVKEGKVLTTTGTYDVLYVFINDTDIKYWLDNGTSYITSYKSLIV